MSGNLFNATRYRVLRVAGIRHYPHFTLISGFHGDDHVVERAWFTKTICYYYMTIWLPYPDCNYLKEQYEVERQKRQKLSHATRQREKEELEYRKSRVQKYQEQEARKKQVEHSYHLIERNKAHRLDDRVRMVNYSFL